MTSTATAISTGSALNRNKEIYFFFGLIGFATLAFIPRIQLQETLLASFVSAGLLLGVWFGVLYWQKLRGLRQLDVTVHLVSSHYVQAAVQISIYLYWAYYWQWITHGALLILGQLVFAYLFEALLCWSRNKSWRIGFGPFPIVLSTNLFLCFKDGWFYYQFILIALAFLAKEFITWERLGRQVHIFNPSSFPLFVFAILLLAMGATNLTWAQDIAIKLNNPDHIYLWIFGVGLIVQALFHVTPVTLAAGLALLVLNLTYTAATGTYWFLDAGIPIAVFLGMHLLVTDPATSPRNNTGRFIFGFLYGAGVFALYGLLEHFGEPSFYDKLLCVPILNLAVTYIERLGAPQGMISRVLSATPFRAIMAWSPRSQNQFAMAIWIALFAFMYWAQVVGPQHPGQRTEFWQEACGKQWYGACKSLERIYHNRCSAGNAQACLMLADRLREQQDDATGMRMLSAESLACEYGSITGCIQTNELMSKDNASLLQSSCDKGDANGCYIFGANKLKGLGGPSDPEAARKYFSRACQLRLGVGCSLLGDFQYYGVAMNRNVAAAIRYYDQSCLLSYGPACQKLSDIYKGSKDMERNEGLSLWYRRKACAIGMKELC